MNWREVIEGTEARPSYMTARLFLLTGAFWMIVAVLYGFIGAIALVAPDAIDHAATVLLGEGAARRLIEWLTFGRVRPTHVNIVAFGFITGTLFGGAFYVIPAVTRSRLYSETMGVVCAALWNAILLAIVITQAMGLTQSREYAEAIWEIDVLVVVVFVLMFVNILMTLLRRREKLLYVSVWYLYSAVIWTSVVFIIGNVMWDMDRLGAMVGMTDAVWAWFYGHNILGLLITPLAVGMAYYIIPRATGAPLYSHTLSLIGFWTLLLMYTHTGTHHLIQAPAPLWLKVIAIVDSIGLLVPVFTFLVNIWLPLKDRWGALHRDVSARFVFAGTIFYFITCVQGPLQSLPSVQRVTHFNNWVIAHAHLALVGFAGMIAMGTIYFVAPLVFRRKIYSLRLAEFQYWLILIGTLGFLLVLTGAGLVQGNSWLNGEGVYRVLPTTQMYMVGRATVGVTIVAAAFIQFYNLVMTAWRGEELSGA